MKPPHLRVLIVESDADIGWLWQRHLQRAGATVELVMSQEEAVDILSRQDFAVIVINLIVKGGSALAVADYVSYRQPDTKVIFVTNSTFFSDGSIFQHVSNACAFIPIDTRPDDLAAMVEHYGTSR
ncbi:MAG: response regulator [Albidovulum sp.]